MSTHCMTSSALNSKESSNISSILLALLTWQMLWGCQICAKILWEGRDIHQSKRVLVEREKLSCNCVLNLMKSCHVQPTTYNLGQKLLGCHSVFLLRLYGAQLAQHLVNLAQKFLRKYKVNNKTILDLAQSLFQFQVKMLKLAQVQKP